VGKGLKKEERKKTRMTQGILSSRVSFLNTRKGRGKERLPGHRAKGKEESAILNAQREARSFFAQSLKEDAKRKNDQVCGRRATLASGERRRTKETSRVLAYDRLSSRRQTKTAEESTIEGKGVLETMQRGGPDKGNRLYSSGRHPSLEAE